MGIGKLQVPQPTHPPIPRAQSFQENATSQYSVFGVMEEDRKPLVETVQQSFPDSTQPLEHNPQLPLATSLLPPSESLEPPPNISLVPSEASTLTPDALLLPPEQLASVPEHA